MEKWKKKKYDRYEKKNVIGCKNCLIVNVLLLIFGF